MKTTGVKRKLLFASMCLLAFVALFYLVYHPWQLNWGAGEDEVRRSIPGDEIVAKPTFNATRAVTVDAPPEAIWPWLVQIGYRRAGFYSWAVLDNDGIASAERVLPQFQDLKAGDLVPLGKNANARVVGMEPRRELALAFEPSSASTWAWGLYPIDPEHTRLVSRLRVRTDRARTHGMLRTFAS